MRKPIAWVLATAGKGLGTFFFTKPNDTVFTHEKQDKCVNEFATPFPTHSQPSRIEMWSVTMTQTASKKTCQTPS